MEKTKLLWDEYIDYLIEEIEQSKFMKRAKDKPMFAASHEQEPHRTSRLEHLKMSATIAKRIAKGLNLNENYVYAAMLLHDAGHPFSAHDGEEMFNGEAILQNCQYFHHNAKGVETVEIENICEKAIDRIPNIENQPELRKKLAEEFPYFLDIIISHDGEASPEEMYRKEIDYPDIATAVESKLRMATAQNGKYKFVSQTPEGKIAKFADVIAYLATDIQDRFRSGVNKEFPKEYLILLGEIFAKNYVSSDEEKISIAINEIKNIEEKHIKRLVFNTENNNFIIQTAREISEEILRGHLNMDVQSEESQEKSDELIDKYVERYINIKDDMSIERKKALNADRIKLKKCIGNFIQSRSSVIEEITGKMQEFFIDDLLKNSATSDYIHFSKHVEKVFFDAKKLNYKCVGQGKWRYLEKEQPEAVHEIIYALARALRKSGVIAHCFNDKAIRDQIKEPEALKYMFSSYTEESEYEKYKKYFKIRDRRISNSKYKGGAKEKKEAYMELFAAGYTYVQDLEKQFAVKYMNTFYAIEDQIRCKVDSILGRLSEKDKKARKTYIEYYDELIRQDEEEMRKLIIEECGPIENITEEMRKKIIAKLTQLERLKMEEKMSVQLAIDYVSGKSDRSFNKLASQLGLMGPNLYEFSSR